MRLTIVGCGDAFGSGGRLQSCYHVAAAAGTFLIDCGASALIGLRRQGLDPNGIQSVFLSHLHGDHFAGLVWFLLDALHVSKRQEPLTIVGPAGTEARLMAAAEALFPRSTAIDRPYELRFLCLEERKPLMVGGVSVTAFEVKHFSGAPPYALRFEAGGKVLAFSGDTEWVDSLIEAGREADLYISECYMFDGTRKFHMSYEVIAANIDRMAPRRTLLTHMSRQMLENADKVDASRFLLAEDGLALDI